jgi:hypothetical protein
MSQRNVGWPLHFGVQFGTSEFQDLFRDERSWLRRASAESGIPVLSVSGSAEPFQEMQRLLHGHVVVDASAHFRKQIRESGLQVEPFEGMHLQFFYTSLTHATYWGRHTILSLSDSHAVLVRSQPDLHEPHDDEPVWESLVPFENLELEPIEASTILVNTEARDAGVIEHRRVQNMVADWLREHDESPLRLSTQDIRVDVAWRTARGNFVCEVKSTTDENERTQIRDGVGQVIEYASSLDATPILMLSRPASSPMRIRGALERGVFVLWPSLLLRLKPQDLHELSPIDLNGQYGLK